MPQGSLFLPSEVAQGDLGPTLWPEGQPWTLGGLGGVIIPSLSGPTLTWVLILSVDPKLEDWKQERVGGEGGKGVSRSLAWQAVQAAVAGGTCVPSPLTHTPCKRVGGQPAPSPGPPACCLPAGAEGRAVPGPGASQHAGRRHPCPRFTCPFS